MNNLQQSQNYNFQGILPSISLPNPRESILGYTLRLDYLNGFLPRTIIKYLLQTEIENITFDLEQIDTSIDYNKLSRMVNVSKDTLLMLSINSIRERVFGVNDIIAAKSISYTNFKICPLCIKSWDLPITFLLSSNINTCLLHGIKLITSCTCGKVINFFNSKSIMNCSNQKCRNDYRNLVFKQDTEILKKEQSYQSLFDGAISLKKNLKKNDFTNRVRFLCGLEQAVITYIYRLFGAQSYRSIRFSDLFLNCYNQTLFDFSSVINLLEHFSMTYYEFTSLNLENNETISTQISELEIIHNNQNIKELNKKNLGDFDSYKLLSSIKPIHDFEVKKVLDYFYSYNSYISGKAKVFSNDIIGVYNFSLIKRDQEKGIHSFLNIS